jgi:replicative DNA helicase
MNKSNRETKIAPTRIAQAFSLQAEEAVIGALLTEAEDTYARIGDKLTEDHFFDPFCRATFAKAMKMMAAGEIPDQVTLSAALEGIVDLTQDEIFDRYLRTVDAYPSSANLTNWSKVITTKSIERKMAAMGEQIMQLAHAQEITADQKLSEAHVLLAGVGSTMSSDTIVPAADMVSETMVMMQENLLNGGGMFGVPSGFTELDKLTSGFGKGDLVIVAARPSMGKTSFALSMAAMLAGCLESEKRVGVLMFSMEMGTTQIGMRWLSLLENVPLQNMRKSQITQAEWDRLNRAAIDSPNTPFYMEESSSLTIEQLAAKARRLMKEHPFNILVIDYLQLIETDPNKSRTEGVSAVSRALKQLAKELQIPVMALSQLNRTLEQRQDKRPIMSDLRESGAIEQDADVILFVYRDEVYNANSIDKGIAEIIIGKQRNGGLGTVRLAFDGPTTRFRDGPSRFSSDHVVALRDVTGEGRS